MFFYLICFLSSWTVINIQIYNAVSAVIQSFQAEILELMRHFNNIKFKYFDLLIYLHFLTVHEISDWLNLWQVCCFKLSDWLLKVIWLGLRFLKKIQVGFWWKNIISFCFTSNIDFCVDIRKIEKLNSTRAMFNLLL